MAQQSLGFGTGSHEEPLLGIAPWIGAKSMAVKIIGPKIASIPHRHYAEPFVGMGSVFFGRGTRAASEALGDLSHEVINLFRIVQRHPRGLLDELLWTVSSRQEFDRLAAQDPAGLTDIERAARYWYLQKEGYGGRVWRHTYSAKTFRPKGVNFETFKTAILKQSKRLAGVSIHQGEFAAFIAANDGPDTLFYLDPPYFGLENYYGKNMFARSDFAALADQLAGIEGRFIMSINDHSEIRRLFGAFTIETISFRYSVNQQNQNDNLELLITKGP